MRTERSFCRLCLGHCAVKVQIDDDRIVAIEPDRDDPVTLGYSCFKGLQAGSLHHSHARLTHPLKRQPDGSWVSIPLAQAYAEIGERLQSILDRAGPQSIGGYKGSGAFFNASASMMLNQWLAAIGSAKAFSSVTIDQSAKAVAAGRLGIWPAGRIPFHEADLFLIVGGNPLVSVSTLGFDTRNPAKRLKQAKARGMQLAVIDPRRTETARQADLFLQPLPGEDVAILAALLHIILREGWQDHAFCAEHVGDLEALREALLPCTPAWAAERAGVSVEALETLAHRFAVACPKGVATSATGPDMSPHSNLAEHLVECLNVVCGRYLREGDTLPNPGVLQARWPRLAQVISAPRWWEQGYRSRFGYGLLDGELPTGSLADEILEPGEDALRALIAHGGNPASSVPDQPRMVAALKQLELLVVIDPFLSETAALAHYVLPPKLPYERPDLPLFLYESLIYPEPYSRYTPALIPAPAEGDCVDEALLFWELAERLGVRLNYWGTLLPSGEAPTLDQLLAIAAQQVPGGLPALKASPTGRHFPELVQQVLPADPASAGQFTTCPADVVEELRRYREQRSERSYPWRLAVRRQRDRMNSFGRQSAAINRRGPRNCAYLHPAAIARLGLLMGDQLEIRTSLGALQVEWREDESIRDGVVSLSHGFGWLPDQEAPDGCEGVNPNRILGAALGRQSINAMPSMTGVAVALRRCPRV